MRTSHYLLPPGKYYIGDPCYVFNDSTWDKLLDVTDSFQNDELTEFGGGVVWGYSTAVGDGVYTDQNDNEFSVDSGVLAAIPIDLIENPDGEANGTVVDAPNGLQVEHDNGTFWFGVICIKTAGDEDEDEDTGYDDPDAEEIF
jgi:hypothetical protein